MKSIPSFIKLTALYFLILCINGQSFLNAQAENSLYGVTATGGSDNKGIIFHIDAKTGTQVHDHSFLYNKGKLPLGNLTYGGNGKFYGMTGLGGANERGVIFEWDPVTNTYTKKFDFDGTNGEGPRGSFILNGGKLYGTTGSNSGGVIFEWDPATDTYTRKLDFERFVVSGTKELFLFGGKFYGIAESGGIDGRGIIFEWDPVTNIFTKKIDFDTDKGASPYSSLTLYGGKFYGITMAGGTYNCGTIYEWDPITNIFRKKRDNDWYQESTLTLYNDKFYGFTVAMDSRSIYGDIFEWDPITNIYTLKINFDHNVKGSTPMGSLTPKDGKLYGVTMLGGAYDNGVIFEWDPYLNIFIKKYDFSSTTGDPYKGSLIPLDAKFYGMTSSGGENNNGTIYEWDPAADEYTKKIDFDVTNKGERSQGSLTLNSGKMYGVTLAGGAYLSGVIFEYDPASKTYTKKIDLNENTYDDGTTYTNIGGLPSGSLTLCDGKFYGMTLCGGLNRVGVIFEWDPVTNIYTKKIDFDQDKGNSPYGSLTLSHGKLYGMTKVGGVNNLGVIFEYDPATNVYTKKIDFDGATNGGNPYGSLTIYQDKLYGMATYGGVNDCGVIFVYDPTTNTYSKKKDFDFTNGSAPYGSFTQNDGKMYGLTYAGGATQEGVIFEWDPTSNTLIKRVDFDSTANGKKPDGSLTFFDGMFYGMTHYGGSNNLGVAFKWDPNTNVFTKLLDFNGANGGNPIYTQFTVFTTQASSITFSHIQTNQMTFDWIDGAGSKRAVFVKQDSEGSSSPLNNSTYSASTSFGSGSQIGTSGWYCVFNGTTHSSGITMTNLIPNTTYRVMVCEYDGSVGEEQYEAITTTGNPQNQTTLHDLATTIPPSASLGKFKVYPNPTMGAFKIESLEELSDKPLIEICDLYGKVIFSSYFENFKGQQIDVSRFSKGIYLIKIKYISTTYTQKLLIY